MVFREAMKSYLALEDHDPDRAGFGFVLPFE